MKEKLKWPIMKPALIVSIPIKIPVITESFAIMPAKNVQAHLSFSLGFFLVIKANIHVGRRRLC